MSSYYKSSARQINRQDLEEYLVRLKSRLTQELKKYGYSWESLVAAFKLPAGEKQLLDQEWWSHYLHGTMRPNRPNPVEYDGYLEYLRIESLLKDPRVQMVESIFGV